MSTKQEKIVVPANEVTDIRGQQPAMAELIEIAEQDNKKKPARVKDQAGRAPVQEASSLPERKKAGDKK